MSGPSAQPLARAAFALAVLLAGCGGTQVTLHAPRCAENQAREGATLVDVEPIATRSNATQDSTVHLDHPEPAEVLTNAVRQELAGRALTGGERGGYRVKCTLDRFALRTRVGMVGSAAIATLYVDLACAAERMLDGVLVWRGALRGRAMASATTPLSSETALVQGLADRTMSDAAREVASDLAVRALGLGGEPSARVFADEAARARSAGVDDTIFGPAGLSEAPDRVALVAPSLRDIDPQVRAAAWNAIAMAMGPGERWLTPEPIPDDAAIVRYYQYKALARNASASSITKLKLARVEEEEAWLREMLTDALATGGLGLPRR